MRKITVNRKINESLKGNKRALGHKVSKEIRKKLSEVNKGHKVSKETRRKIGKAHEGKKVSKITREKLSKSNKGKKRSEETKRKLSEAHKGKKFSKETRSKMSGSNSYRWKGGITPENTKIRRSIEYRLWRESVFARDNWTCQKTGVKGGDLGCHHIKNFSDHPELRFAIDNGITLSKAAHKGFHSIYGTKNNTRDQLEEYLS